MPQLTQFFQPPLYWQQFEDLIVEIVGETYSIPAAQKIGRPGQAQDGVDVYGQSPRFGRIGIQCKRMDTRDENNNYLPGGAISKAFLKTEAQKALKFNPALDLWIIATTAKRDARSQENARILSEKYQGNGDFQIITWFWDDLVSMLNSYPDVQKKYYQDVINIQSTKDQDILILQGIAQAFDRPAFSDHLTAEDAKDLDQALSDTFKAMRTGELVDRVTRHTIRRSIGGWRIINDVSWRNYLRSVDQQLGETRFKLRTGLGSGKFIINQYGHLVVNDHSAADDLNDHRRKCISLLNSALLQAGLAQLPLPP